MRWLNILSLESEDEGGIDLDQYYGNMCTYMKQ